MADNQENQGNETVEQTENVETAEQEVAESEQAPQTFSQEDVNSIVSQRLAEERAAFAEQMSRYTEQMQQRQAAIEQGVQALTQQRTQTTLTPQQQQAREVLGPMFAEMQAEFDRKLAALAPVATQSFAANFWLDKPKVPDSVKRQTEAMVRQHYKPGQDINELMTSAFTVAASQHVMGQWTGTGAPVQNQTQSVQKPAPRIPATSNQTAELGNTRAPVALGGNKQLDWRGQLEYWAEKDIWPDDLKQGKRR